MVATEARRQFGLWLRSSAAWCVRVLLTVSALGQAGRANSPRSRGGRNKAVSVCATGYLSDGSTRPTNVSIQYADCGHINRLAIAVYRFTFKHHADQLHDPCKVLFVVMISSGAALGRVARPCSKHPSTVIANATPDFVRPARKRQAVSTCPEASGNSASLQYRDHDIHRT